jgi:hypothetical protein
MPTRIATNWENAFLRFGSDPPIKIEDVICYTDEPEEELKYAEDEVYAGIDLSSSDSFTYTFEMQLTCKEYKRISSIVGRGNNWRRMHGKKMIRIPLKERRRHE